MSLASQISLLATRVGTEAKALWTAMNAKAPSASPKFTGTVTLPSTTSIGNVTSTELGYLDGVTSAIQTQLGAKAPTASPTFTGTPAAPTAAAGTNTTQIATTAFVQSTVAVTVPALSWGDVKNGFTAGTRTVPALDWGQVKYGVTA